MCFKTEEDRDQVVAILKTHAEIQDREAIHFQERIGGIKKKKVRREMQEHIDFLESDRDNLNRLAGEVSAITFHGDDRASI